MQAVCNVSLEVSYRFWKFFCTTSNALMYTGSGNLWMLISMKLPTGFRNHYFIIIPSCEVDYLNAITYLLFLKGNMFNRYNWEKVYDLDPPTNSFLSRVWPITIQCVVQLILISRIKGVGGFTCCFFSSIQDLIMLICSLSVLTFPLMRETSSGSWTLS